MFMFGLVDIGLWILNSNQATNAARDGARMGIIDFDTADRPDLPGSMHAAVVDAVNARLDREVPPEQVDVRCVRDGVVLPCVDARVDSDRIEVEVEWHWDLLTPIAGVIGVDRGSSLGSTSMVIAGRPLAPPVSGGDAGDEGTPVATDCVATVTQVTSPVSRKNSSSQLQHSVYVRFTTTGTCSQLRVEFQSPNGEKATQVVCGCEPSPKTEPYLEYTYKGSDNIWTASSPSSPAYVRIYDTTTEVGSATFTVT
jgi:hypothetical protein